MTDYAPQTWGNDPASVTPLSATRLTHMETGIDTGHSELATHEARTDNPHVVTAAQVLAVKRQSGAANVWVQSATPTALAVGDLWIRH